MPRIIISSVLILFVFGLGFVAGWRFKPVPQFATSVTESKQSPATSPFTNPAISAETKENSQNQSGGTNELITQNTSQSSKQEPEKNGSALDKFRGLLNKARYREAVNFYQDTEKNQPGMAAAFKRELEQFLELKLKSAEFVEFSNLTEYWLNTYYSDLDVLLLLADYNSLQGYYGETISLYQLMYSYAIRDGDLAEIDNEFSAFVHARDARLMEREAWYELQSFYELIEQAGIAKAANLYRLAEVYLHNGYPENARYVVEQLIASNRNVNRAQALLTEIDKMVSGDYEKRPFRSLHSQILPLEKHGNHFVVVLTLQNNVRLKLLIDTGASITAVSHASFTNKVGYSNHTLLPSRLFNTANGVTRGEVLLIHSLYFGGEELRNTEIAIVPMPESDEIDGLLGMNILSQFRFHIDQENAELVLDKKRT